MKAVKLFLSTLLIITLCFIPTNYVNALEEVSELYPVNGGIVSFSTNEVNYSMQFTKVNYETGINDAIGWISGTVLNKTPKDLDLYETVYYYNQNDDIIGYSVNYETIRKNKSDTFSINLYRSDLKGDYVISDIAYYKLYVKNLETNQPSNKSNNNDKYIDTYGNGEYAITKYNIDIKVNENNTFNITEYITAYFNVDKHGIFRKIPLRNEIFRLDGTKSRNRTRISDVKVNEEASMYNESGYRILKIGNPNYTITGPKDYIITYLYNIGKDPSKNFDEFYFNIIGNEWDTTISDITFTITMPKDFDETKLGFSSGSFGSTDSSNITYEVNRNVITGSYNSVLNAGESLTVRLELPEGYFVGASDNFHIMMILYFVLPLIFAAVSLLVWYLYGRNDKVIDTVEFYPPEGFNSAEIGFLYKGKAEAKDVVSLLIYLADKGYLKIVETKAKKLFGNTDSFKIVKLKDYDGDSEIEKIFFNELFFHAKSSKARESFYRIKYSEELENEENLTVVTPEDLNNTFYTTLNRILTKLNKKENKEIIIKGTSFWKKAIIVLMIIASVFTIVGVPTYEYAGISEIALTVFIILFYIPFYSVIFIKKIPIPFRMFWGGFTIFHSIMFFSSLPIKDAIFDNPIYLIGVLSGAACIAVMILCFKSIVNKRTPYGNEILGKINGFKKFLETAEKPKLEELVMQNPSYFYNILPYTYVLGVSDKWIKKFESINIQAPDWYSGSTAFNMVAFSTFMNSTMTSASSSMSSSPSSSSSDGGGSSGGGSSGGGSGGGGGGSW